jgi:hypothetical protein
VRDCDVVAVTGNNGSDPPRAREPWNVGHVGVAVALWVVALVLFWRLLRSWDEITGVHLFCTDRSSGANQWVPGALGLFAGAGLYALITPPYRKRYVVWSVLMTLGIGGGIYFYSFAVWFGQCLS